MDSSQAALVWLGWVFGSAAVSSPMGCTHGGGGLSLVSAVMAVHNGGGAVFFFCLDLKGSVPSLSL